MKSILLMFRKWPKKYLVIGLIILLGIVSLYFYFIRTDQKIAEVVAVKKGDLVVEVSAAGTLVGQHQIPLSLKTAGKIGQINVKEADLVYRSQILASLDNREQLITLEQAQNTLRDKQATVDKVLDDIHLFQYGMGGFDNIGTLNETMTQRQLRTTVEVLRDNAYDSVKLAQKALEDTLIVAPASGVVTEVNFISGQNVSSQDVIIKLIDTAYVFFDAEVDEADIDKISLGQKGNITLDAYPDQTFEGKVLQIIPQSIITTTGAHIVKVRLKLSNLPQLFINGLTGQVSIEIEKAQNTLIIPIEALEKDNNMVTIQTSKGVEKKTVQAGIQSDTEVEIKEGLSEGDQVILNP